MRKLIVTGLAAALVGVLAACSQGAASGEETGSSAAALDEDGCKYVDVAPDGKSADGITPTNFGKLVSNQRFDGCQSLAMIQYQTPDSYPGDTLCPNQAIIRLYSPSGAGAYFGVEAPESRPNDQATCEATHITGTIWGKTANGTWAKLNTPAMFGNDQNVKEDYAGVWRPYPNAPSCTFGYGGSDHISPTLDFDLSQYSEIRFVGSRYRVQTTGKTTTIVPLRANLFASNYCIS